MDQCLVKFLYYYNCVYDEYDYLRMDCIMSVLHYESLMDDVKASTGVHSAEFELGCHSCGFQVNINELTFDMQPLTDDEAAVLCKFKKAELSTKCRWYNDLMYSINDAMP